MTLAEKLTQAYAARRREALIASNPRLKAIQLGTAAFEKLLDTRVAPLVAQIEAAFAQGATVPTAQLTEITDLDCGDDYREFDLHPQWFELRCRAATCGYVLQKTHIIRPLTAEEATNPDAIGYGRIGGKPVGVKVSFLHQPMLLVIDQALAPGMPSQAQVETDMTAEVNQRDPLAAGNVFTVTYKLPVIPAGGWPSCCKAWMVFSRMCADMGLGADFSHNGRTGEASARVTLTARF